MPRLVNRPPRIKRSVVIEPQENDALNEIAREEDRSFNAVVRLAIKDFLARRRQSERPPTHHGDADSGVGAPAPGSSRIEAAAAATHPSPAAAAPPTTGHDGRRDGRAA